MDTYDSSALPAETRDWLERKAEANGYSSAAELVEQILCRLHELEAAQSAEIEGVLLERLKEPSSEMTDEDWAQMRKELRERHAARKG